MMEAELALRAQHLLGFSRSLCRVEKLLSKRNGENFNIFRVLNIRRYETRTHTPMLRELLDPNGSHGQGSAFLRLFLDRCDIKDFDAETATVKQEHHIGEKTQTSGGRLDLYLSDRTGVYQIGIENKIDAFEQENQIRRYQEFLKNGILLYLTLGGSKPTSYDSKTESSVKVKCISYKKHISAWLEDCQRHATTSPLVRETITQYLHLIRELTHQNEDNKMSTIITEAAALKDQADLQAFFALCNARKEVEKQIIAKLEKQIDLMAQELGIERAATPFNFGEKFSGFTFVTPMLKNNNLTIRFEFGGANGGGFYYGFKLVDCNQPVPKAEELQAAFDRFFGVMSQKSTWWAAWTYWGEFQSWNGETLAKIHFEDGFINALRERVEILMRIASNIYPDKNISL
jgi:PD-(D/E)XK nuclease superfamily